MKNYLFILKVIVLIIVYAFFCGHSAMYYGEEKKKDFDHGCQNKGVSGVVGQVCATRNNERCLIVVGGLLASENNLLSVDAVTINRVQFQF